MKKVIKNSIDKIKINNSQKEKIYEDIHYKNSYDSRLFYKLSIACIIFVCSFIIIEKPIEEHEISMINTREINYNDSIYDQIDVPYEIGSLTGHIKINEISYDVYENKLNNKSIIIYNENYEVYFLREE